MAVMVGLFAGLRMYTLHAWFSLSVESVENAICDSVAMHRFVGGAILR